MFIILVEMLKHHDMCNLEKDNFSGISKKKKTVKGFGYLNELANKLKIIKNKNSNINFDEFTKIIEDDVKNQEFSNEKNPATNFNNSTKNLFKLLDTVKDIKSINEVEDEEDNNYIDYIHDYKFAEKNIMLKNNENSNNIFEKSEITKNLLLKTSNNEEKNNYIKYCENIKLNKKENEKYSFFDIQNKTKFSKNSEENNRSNNTKNKIKFNFVQNSKDNKFNNDSSFSLELKKVEIEREENSSNKYKSNLKSVKKINKFVTNNKKQDFSILKLLKCKVENLSLEETVKVNNLDEINNQMKNKLYNESNFHKLIHIEKNIHDSNIKRNPAIIKNFYINSSSKIIKHEKPVKLFISNNNKKSNKFEKFKIFNNPDKEKIQTISYKFIKKTEHDDHIYLLNSFISSNSSSQNDSDETCHVSKIINYFDNPTSKNSENLNNSFHHKNYKNEKTDFLIKLHDCSSHFKELKKKT